MQTGMTSRKDNHGWPSGRVRRNGFAVLLGSPRFRSSDTVYRFQVIVSARNRRMIYSVKHINSYISKKPVQVHGLSGLILL